MEIILTVNKANVYNEVAKTTSYIGSKKESGQGAYKRVFTSDDDRLMLERFWNECCDEATSCFKQFLFAVSGVSYNNYVDLSAEYSVGLSMPSSFDEELTGSINSVLFNFFVKGICGRWLNVAEKDEAATYAAEAAALLNDLTQKIYYRKKPIRTPV